jgi:hypothetical protein
LLGAGLPVSAQTTASAIRLSGIISLPGSTRAILEIAGNFQPEPKAWIYAQGEREGDREVMEINPVNGTLKLNVPGLAKRDPGLKLAPW